MPRYRLSEWLAIGYFLYVAAIAPLFIRDSWRALLLAAAIAGLFWVAGFCRPVYRDFAPLAAALAAYREMDWFTPAVQDHHLERVWVVWDRVVLNQYGFRAAIESAGPVLPSFLELCYFLVYGIAPVAVWVLYANGKGIRARQFWVAYLAATLGAYALFPYFPSEPPRTAFPGADMPQVEAVRRLNMLITGGYGIHSSVFPSAHVSSAFSAGWALLWILREKRWIGWIFVGYAACVALATFYGRYHYGVDAVAGFALSFVAFPALWIAEKVGE